MNFEITHASEIYELFDKCTSTEYQITEYFVIDYYVSSKSGTGLSKDSRCAISFATESLYRYFYNLLKVTGYETGNYHFSYPYGLCKPDRMILDIADNKFCDLIDKGIITVVDSQEIFDHRKCSMKLTVEVVNASGVKHTYDVFDIDNFYTYTYLKGKNRKHYRNQPKCQQDENTRIDFRMIA